MYLLMIVLLVLGCIATVKAFGAEDPKQKRFYGLIAIFIGGILFYLGNYVIKY
jgi:hypothetical protein